MGKIIICPSCGAENSHDGHCDYCGFDFGCNDEEKVIAPIINRHVHRYRNRKGEIEEISTTMCLDLDCGYSWDFTWHKEGGIVMSTSPLSVDVTLYLDGIEYELINEYKGATSFLVERNLIEQICRARKLQYRVNKSSGEYKSKVDDLEATELISVKWYKDDARLAICAFYYAVFGEKDLLNDCLERIAATSKKHDLEMKRKQKIKRKQQKERAERKIEINRKWQERNGGCLSMFCFVLFPVILLMGIVYLT